MHVRKFCSHGVFGGELQQVAFGIGPEEQVVVEVLLFLCQHQHALHPAHVRAGFPGFGIAVPAHAFPGMDGAEVIRQFPVLFHKRGHFTVRPPLHHVAVFVGHGSGSVEGMSNLMPNVEPDLPVNLFVAHVAVVQTTPGHSTADKHRVVSAVVIAAHLLRRGHSRPEGRFRHFAEGRGFL